MDLTKIRGVAIPREVKEWCEKNSENRSFRYCSFLSYKNGEIVERIFGTRRYKTEGVKIGEVMRHSTGGSSVIVRNLIYRPLCGYTVVFEPKDIYEHQSGYAFKIFYQEDFDVWSPASGNIGVSYVCINSQMIFDVEEFKYCGYTSGSGGVIRYLDEYRKDKSLEYFGKMGIGVSPVLMKKAKKSKAFRKWLFENHEGVKAYGVQAALYAYESGKDLKDAKDYCFFKNQFDRMVAQRIPEIRGTKLDRAKVLEYVDTNNIDYTLYDDYLKAIKYLKLNLKDTKNIYPYDFQRMHDLRAAEYAARKLEKDREKRAELYESFKEAANNAKQYETSDARYMLVAPSDVTDLINEGDKLCHCVGRMGYDKKMADGVSIIMFVRRVDEPNTPFVTVEWRVDKKILNQCYGFKDSKPSDDVMAFVNNWASQMKARIVE